MISIDWENSPEGTTHANPADNLGIWRKVEGGEYFWWDAIHENAWRPLHPMAVKRHLHNYIERPSNK